ncbi:MAG: transcription elongation factor GreA [Alphaproteobacteria bacterium]|nr:transcription elongation factor GreA [Alphaproteobacteria bacterium]
MVDKVPMTLKGYQSLEEELKHLRGTERLAIIRAIAEAREHGDLSENAEYHAARERQSFVEGRIQELEDKIGRADVIDVSKLDGKNVKFGATITLVDEDTDEETRYQIVGEDEADIKAGFLSVTSPLARALIGKTVKDRVEVSTPKGSKAYEIVKVIFK